MTYAMKDSGVEWIGIIPEHWEVKRTQDVLKYQPPLKVNQEWRDYQLLSLRVKGVCKKNILSTKGKLPESFSTYQKVNKNDMVFCLFDLDLTAVTAGLSKYDGMITSAYSIFKTINNSIPLYWDYYYKYIDHTRPFNSFYKSLRKVIRPPSFNKIPIMYPPKKEQEIIASYLDKHVGNLDKYIESAEKKIKLLEEQKTSLIYETVTHGLNPDAKMKDSGIEWIGMIPEHWKIERVKENVNIETGGFTPNTKNQDLYQGDDLWCTIADISKENKYIDNTKNKIAGEYFQNKHKIPVGSLLFSFKLSPGRVAFTKKSMFINEAICAFMPSSKMDLNFLYYASPLFIVKNAKENIFNAKILNQPLIQNALIVVPPKKEQEDIASYLDTKCSRIEKEVELLKKKVELLKEYKTSLIFEVVTGKKSVVQ